jgi:rhodanese-related sulfurtransferase
MTTQVADVPSAPATRAPSFSFVLETPPAAPADAHRHFAAKLTVETDPWDVNADLQRGGGRFVVVDARSAEAYAECHVPGAVSLPHRAITAESAAAALPGSLPVVVYCWGPACNAAAKAAVRLAALGYAVKEMVGGLEYWRHEGHAVEGTLGDAAPLHG